MLPFIQIGSFRFQSYLFMALVAFLASTLLIVLRRKPQGVPVWEALALSCTTLVGGIIGAKIFHLAGRVIQGEAFWTVRFWQSVRLDSGYVWYGGVIGAFLFLLVYAKIRKMPLRNMFDLMTPFALSFDAIARFGCLFAGCCYGVRVAWGIKIHGVPRFPSPLFESALCLIILALFLIWKPERKRPGILLPLFLALYSAGRFFLEYFRGDAHRGSFLIFSASFRQFGASR
ncbi:MAG: prolipoprotein diacylglyceryl transferase [Oscillospiraceae bacterium]|nr:prolipoprotein diacylglyceryl transferase [Oscillospiraceae bacterium]